MARRERNRDDRDFDTTQLHEGQHGQTLGRDYSGHFFRWSFARRHIKKGQHVLEVGCGQDLPLRKILLRNVGFHCESYTGCDLNKLKESKHQRTTLFGEFDFTTRWKEVLKTRPEGFDVAVNYEVIEHMKVEHGRKLLKGIFECLKPGGTFFLSTPVYDGVRHAANHIHEYTVPELQKEVEKAGFVVERRYGVFMDLRHIKKELPAAPGCKDQVSLHTAVKQVRDALESYYDNDAISCFFAPLYPDHARNNLWVLKKPEAGKKGRK